MQKDVDGVELMESVLMFFPKYPLVLVSGFIPVIQFPL